METETMSEIEILKLQKADCLVKALGTMVVIPTYESDPENIGAKIYKGPIQQPILAEGSKLRTDALNKLNEIINSL